METKTEFEKISLEIVRFMRGKYALDEIADKDNNSIYFMNKKNIVISIKIYIDKYDIVINLNENECNRFIQNKKEFLNNIIDLFDETDLYNNEKKLIYPVRSVKDFDDIKALIKFKFKPNRKTLTTENAIHSKCGHRCDLCIHFTDMNEKLRKRIVKHLINVYDGTDWSMRCSGCDTDGCYVKDSECKTLKCAYENSLTACIDCNKYPCSESTAGYEKLELRTISDDDVTWGILPYVPHQYGN